MRRVSQQKLLELDEHGRRVDGSSGDCYPACIASIFEIPLDQAPGANGNSQEVWDWLALNFAGIGIDVRVWDEPRDHVHHSGFWIATIVSPRFKDHCYSCHPDRETSDPPWYRRDECPRCDGTGWAPGLHAVVMENGKRVWDPHPEVDWDAPIEIIGETVFTVTDPARLAARVLPAPLPAR